MSKQRFLSWVMILLVANMLAACGTETPARMGAYLGPAPGKAAPPSKQALELPEGGIQAGLLVINDTTAPGSAPSLSQETLASLTEGIRILIMKAVPITFVKVLDNTGIVPQGNPQQLIDRAKQEGLAYLMLAILSSNESEIPTYLPINGIIQGGGGPNTVPGYEAQNFAIVEFALLDGTTGRTLINVHGRAYSTLYRLNVATESNAYPVVTRSRLFNPIFPKGNNAHDVLRGIAGDDAIKQSVLHLREAWEDATSI